MNNLHTSTKKYIPWKILAIVSLFLVVLTGSRFIWITFFYNADQPHIKNGVLDLRDWDAAESHIINLDGQWEFYPHVFLMDHRTESLKDDCIWLQVPGNWNDTMETGNSNPFGYGTYRLQILINPDHDYTYSIRVPSVRSSSELFVNDKLIAKSGQPATNMEDYVSKNLPYSASFTTGGNEVIEVVVQAANFKDYRDSGIVRSMKFGTVDKMDKETRLSIGMQQTVAIVFLLHAIYAIILYFSGSKDRYLLYFSLLMTSVMFMNLLGSEEKILHFWLQINYEWGFKLVHLSIVGISYALFQYIQQQIRSCSIRISWSYTLICLTGALLSLLLPVRHLLIIQPCYLIVMLIAILLSTWFMCRKAIKQLKDNVLLLLACLALISNLVWWSIFLLKGISTVYYPFDLIVATACFASIWFKNYFWEHLEANKLASKLQEAGRQKDEFLANTSHELRNPLHGILNLSQAVLVREQHSLQDQSVRNLENVLSVGRRMSLMLNDLLDVMRLKQNGTRLQLTRFSIQTLVTGVFDMLYYMTEGKKVRLINQIPLDFPQVFADEKRVIQILYNLVHNAIKFTNEGEVSIHGDLKNGRAYIVVSDTGIGMDEVTVQHVFEPYEQANQGKSIIEGGFGLGLSISKQLVEFHGGTLQVNSVPGQGSEFIFSLQLTDSPANSLLENTERETATSVENTESAITSTIPLRLVCDQQTEILADRPRILVVDDDPMNLKVVESILSIEYFDMTMVTSGIQCLELLDVKEWDLIISDVMMPQMSGYELTRRIRNRFTLTELPILLLTARNQSVDIENGFIVGANDYVTKPVDALELRSRVRALTAVKQSVRERLQMEAAWLQAQIQPHFLFNTLNAITALSETNLDKMRNLLDELSDFLKNKFQFKNMDELSPIEDELNIIRSYLFIEQIRFEDRLQVSWEVDDCRDLMIPLLTIQPLVENAIRHGIMKRSRGGNLVIRISNYETYANISVEDDGVGMDEVIVERILKRKLDGRSGVGLINTDLRLQRHFGKGLQIKSKQGIGTTISFIINKKIKGKAQ